MMDILINTYDTMAKILLVEDEVNIASFIERGLREFGHEVYVAYDGAAGWELTQKNDFQLLILDIIMPKMNGLQLCKQYRQRFGYHAPVIMLTALGTTEDIVSGLDAGADDYLVKPFSFSELLARVRAQLRQHHALNSTLEISGLRMDSVSQSVSRDNISITLTRKEFQLLWLLASRAGEIIPRTVIASEIWGINFDSDTNTVDVAIRRLRAKVDDPFPEKLIATIRGMGYSFVAVKK